MIEWLGLPLKVRLGFGLLLRVMISVARENRSYHFNGFVFQVDCVQWTGVKATYTLSIFSSC